MGQSGQARGQFGYPDNQIVGERTGAFLRELFPRDTAKRTAKATGVPVTTVHKWLSRASAPNAAGLFACFLAFGPCFLSAICPDVAWVEMLVLLFEREQLGAAIEQNDEGLSRAVAMLRGRR